MSGEGAAMVLVRYWAGARSAAGVESDTVPGVATVGELVQVLRGLRPELGPVLDVSTLLLAGRSVGPEVPLQDGDEVEVLPPFAGG